MPHAPLPASDPSLATWLFSGHYRDVLRATIDSVEGTWPDAETAWVVGALVFSGRQDEALAVFRAWQRGRAAHVDVPASNDEDAGVEVTARFFLVVGECRAGRYASAIEQCARVVSARRRVEPLHGFFVHQAIGLLRYFTGRVGATARHAIAARSLSVEACFPYGRMLALDLLGHALVARGDVYAGLTVLQQAAELAETLGLVDNAGAPRNARTANRARYLVTGSSPRQELADLVASLQPEDAYARHMLLSELAIQHALAGDGPKADQCLGEASLLALPDGDRRARVRRLLAEACVIGFGRGPEAAREKLDAARTMLEPALDDALAVEIHWAAFLVAGRASVDAVPPDELTALARRTRASRAAFLATPFDQWRTSPAASEDRLAQLLAALERDREEAMHRIVSEGLWGLLPRLFGHVPGRRLYLLHDRAILVVEDHGTVVPLEMPGAVLVTLLGALADGPSTKEQLVQRVWRVRVYRPERHDALVHTAAARLRNALGSWRAWVRITEQGYGLAEGVVIHEDRAEPAATVPPPRSSPPPRATFARDDGDSEPTSLATGASETSLRFGESAVGPERCVRVHAALAAAGASGLSTKDIAGTLGVSEMTAFRLLATLVREGDVERTGQGKNTRYKRFS